MLKTLLALACGSSAACLLACLPSCLQEMINYDKVKTLIDRFDPEAHAARAAHMAMMQQQQQQQHGERLCLGQQQEVCRAGQPPVCLCKGPRPRNHTAACLPTHKQGVCVPLCASAAAGKGHHMNGAAGGGRGGGGNQRQQQRGGQGQVPAMLVKGSGQVAGAAALAVAGAGKALMPLVDKLATSLISDNPLLLEDLRWV